jgi:hypothetical protein
MSLFGPPTVAVHDHRDMLREFVGIEALQEFHFGAERFEYSLELFH